METEKTPRNPQTADKYIVRLPDGMREKISEIAKSNKRSMNAEIVSMLQQAMDDRASSVAGASLDIDALAEALASKLAARLKDTP
ncbi:Arc family DNA-binding protein [[Empedobacter] haloabium]|uniref:Arc family DNA-binding protein n=1 Tax=[Empedobacter] haloabium TaxID=592317 RepID=A0ABZ1URW9_9BURK